MQILSPKVVQSIQQEWNCVLPVNSIADLEGLLGYARFFYLKDPKQDNSKRLASEETRRLLKDWDKRCQNLVEQAIMVIELLREEVCGCFAFEIGTIEAGGGDKVVAAWTSRRQAFQQAWDALESAIDVARNPSPFHEALDKLRQSRERTRTGQRGAPSKRNDAWTMLLTGLMWVYFRETRQCPTSPPSKRRDGAYTSPFLRGVSLLLDALPAEMRLPMSTVQSRVAQILASETFAMRRLTTRSGRGRASQRSQKI